MSSHQCSVPASSSTQGRPGTSPVAARPAREVLARPTAGRAPQSVAPAGPRRDSVRPAGRPARLDGTSSARPVRGGWNTEGLRRPVVAGAVRHPDAQPAPLRLTRRGRRVVSGLSIAIGLSIAAATAVVQLGQSDGGLELAGSSTVVVHAGDTLWDLAQEVAPQEDPRAVVDAIVELNGLHDVDLVPGMELQLP